MTEIRVQGEGTPLSETHPRENLRPAEPLPPGHALPAEPARPAPVVTDDPEVARAQIEETRSRMSETIDEIEDALTRKKAQLQDRLDVMSRVRENPYTSTGIAFGAGLLLGLLTGGDDEEEEYYRYTAADGDEELWRSRAEEWEGRARRLLRIAREQEEEIHELEERYGGLYAHEIDEHGGEHLEDWEGEEDVRSTLDGLRDTVVSGVTGFVADAVRQWAKGGFSQAQGRT